MEGSLKDVECGTHIHIQVLVTDTIFSRPIHKYCIDHYRGRGAGPVVSQISTLTASCNCSPVGL